MSNRVSTYRDSSRWESPEDSPFLAKTAWFYTNNKSNCKCWWRLASAINGRVDNLAFKHSMLTTLMSARDINGIETTSGTKQRSDYPFRKRICSLKIRNKTSSILICIN